MKTSDVLVFFATKQKRRPKVIFNILHGILTVSNLFWGLNYDVLYLSGMGKQIKKDEYQHHLNLAIQKGWLFSDEAGISLTKAGQKVQNHELEGFHDLKNDYELNMAIESFILAVQVLSEFSFQNHKYLPSVSDVRVEWIVKQWFKAQKQQISSPKALSKKAFDDLIKVAEQLDGPDMNILFNFLANHHDTGLTLEQIASLTDESTFLVSLKLKFILLSFFNHLDEDNMFYSLINYFKKPSIISNSAFESYQLIKAGKSMEEVANMRRIKLNTVKEHLLMNAIIDSDFPFNEFLQVTYQPDTLPSSWQYSDFQSHFPQSDFFAFRLSQIKTIKDLRIHGKY